MKITGIGLFSGENEIVNFDMEDPMSLNPYVLRAWIGLDADELISRFYGFGQTQGFKLYDFKMKPRDIILRILLRPNRALGQTYSELRDNLYTLISANRLGEVELRFNSKIPWHASIKGFINKFEVPHFSKTPEVQITIRCEDPMLRGYSLTQIVPTSIDPMVIVDTDSTAPHGIEMEIVVNNPLSELSIIDSSDDLITTDWSFKLVYDFLAGDIITINSDFSNKYILLERSAVKTPIANTIAPESVWPILFPKTNKFTFSAPTDITVTYLKYKAAFWGV